MPLAMALPPLLLAAPNVTSGYLSPRLYEDIMRSMPIPTVDVLMFTADLHRTLLFNRTNAPVRHVLYSLGGRVLHNELLRNNAHAILLLRDPALTTAGSAWTQATRRCAR